MTYEQREQIFAKDVITTQDLALLLNMDVSTASVQMQNIRRNIGEDNLRLRIKGKLHVQDYLDYFRINPDNIRYVKVVEQNG